MWGICLRKNSSQINCPVKLITWKKSVFEHFPLSKFPPHFSRAGWVLRLFLWGPLFLLPSRQTTFVWNIFRSEWNSGIYGPFSSNFTVSTVMPGPNYNLHHAKLQTLWNVMAPVRFNSYSAFSRNSTFNFFFLFSPLCFSLSSLCTILTVSTPSLQHFYHLPRKKGKSNKTTRGVTRGRAVGAMCPRA